MVFIELASPDPRFPAPLIPWSISHHFWHSFFNFSHARYLCKFLLYHRISTAIMQVHLVPSIRFGIFFGVPLATAIANFDSHFYRIWTALASVRNFAPKTCRGKQWMWMKKSKGSQHRAGARVSFYFSKLDGIWRFGSFFVAFFPELSRVRRMCLFLSKVRYNLDVFFHDLSRIDHSQHCHLRHVEVDR